MLFLNPTAVAQTHPKIDLYLQSITLPHFPGLAALVIKKSTVIHSRGYGRAKLAPLTEISSTTGFQLASTSKQFTAFAIALLIEQGKLQPSDKLSQFFPDMPVRFSEITIDQIIHHTSGLPDYYLGTDLCFRKKPAL